jgi:glycerol uptake facilitator-like aquaporin
VRAESSTIAFAIEGCSEHALRESQSRELSVRCLGKTGACPALVVQLSPLRLYFENIRSRRVSSKWEHGAGFGHHGRARLSGGDVALALLANTVATGAALVALVLTFGPVSGAHLNPAVTLADASQGGLKWRDVPEYIVGQVAGAFVGVVAAHAMFGKPLLAVSQHVRASSGELLGGFIATFGLPSVIWGCVRRRSEAVPLAVGAYITAPYWFTSFANPAVTLARAATNTFSGIRSADVPGFVVAQLLGAAAATALFGWLVPTLPSVADRFVARDSEQTS